MNWLRFSNPARLCEQKVCRSANPDEPWEIAKDRLRALDDAPDEPSPEAVKEALEPIGLGELLEGYQATRVLSLLGAKEPKAPLLRAALIPRSVPMLYDARTLLLAVRQRRVERLGAGRARTALKRKLAELSEDDQRSLAYARSHERELLERARAFEALAKAGVHPVWAARNARDQARQATREREALERRLVS